MKNSRKNRGFSLAEMLIVVAIVIVLAGVSFVGVQRHQRSMTRLEFDTIAKEIFIAAQNHLTAAEGQGYMQKDQYGNVSNLAVDKKGGEATGKTVAYFAVKGDGKSADALNIMLPNYAIDGMIAAGTYIIRYQPSSATVLDVFYSMPGKSNFLTLSGVSLGTGDYASLMGIKGNAAARQSYTSEGGATGVVGYYGGGEIVDRGERLAVPTFEIENAEKLIVRVTDPNADLKYASLKLVITGSESKEERQKVIPLVVVTNESTGQTYTSDTRISVSATKDLYTVILDDITTEGLRFADLNNTGPGSASTASLIPGEDIKIKVIAYSNTKLTNIAISPEKTTNSLFADPVQKTPSTGEKYTGSDITNKIAGIANIRHLENLEADVSGVNTSLIDKAKQITDLSWTDFRTKIGNTPTKIYYKSGDSFTGTEDNCFYPVSPEASLEYDGQNHSIIDVKVDFDGDAGLFGKIDQDNSAVKNLELIDFDVTASSGNAGALAGSATSTTITNVLAHHTNKTDYKTATVTATTGSAGGLIGSATGCTVSKSAAALVVSGSTNAGGLIGTSSGGTVSLSYSGGHTYSGAPKTGTAAAKYSNPHTNVYPVRYFDASNEALYNVTATTNAGGLIGSASSTAISYSYSTCSASAEKAGGLVGTGTDNTIKYCYCTGLIPDQTNTIKTHGAFAGSLGGNQTIKGCKYFEIVNEYRETKDNKLTSGYRYLEKLGNSGTNAEITAFDASADSYNGFSPAKDEWGIAYPYDQGGNAEETNGYGLKVFYKNGDKTGYNLQTVQQVFDAAKKVDTSITETIKVETTDYVKDHYGDWPAPEEFSFVSN